MQKYIKRLTEAKLHEYLKIFPAVAILGPRQCGKSTMIKQLVKKSKNFIYLDLQSSSDLRKLQEPEFFFENNTSKTICIDEIQLAPHLFSVLRSAIDSYRKSKFSILFYRTSGGNEIDLVIETDKKRIAVECKASAAPQLSYGNYSAIEYIKADEIYVVAPVKDKFFALDACFGGLI